MFSMRPPTRILSESEIAVDAFTKQADKTDKIGQS